MHASALLWAGLLAFVAVAFVVDLRFFEPADGSRPSMRRSVAWSVVWLVLALAFGGFIWVWQGSDIGSQFLTGYLLERSLSLDNVFVFALIFSSMAVPAEQRQRMLEIGIVLALGLRLVFIAVGAELVEAVDEVLYVFGAILLFTGVRMAMHRHDEDTVDPERNPGVRIARRMGLSPMMAVILAIATADVIFAVDSIPAIFGITTVTFIVFSANAFALLGMRALYALLEGAADRFEHLKTGLAFILVFIGAKMLVEDLWHIPIAVSLGVIVIALAVSVLASLTARDGPVADQT